MVRSRRYNNYRGRRSKGKTALAVLLILVILAAIVVILLQRHIIYDETGAPRMEVPWKDEAREEASSEPALDLVIRPPEKTVAEIRGFRLPVGTLTREGYDSVMAAVEPAYNAVAVVLKDENGTVYFDADAAVSGSVDTAEDTSDVLAALTGGQLRAIAEISCFRDPKAAGADVDGMGLENTEGYIFYDGANQQWLDPAKPAARRYVCELAVEAAKLGFDEILLTDLGYPTDGKLEQIAYGEAEKSENLKLFLEELRSALEPYGTVITVEVSADVITTGQQEASGQKLTEITAAADRICAPASPEEASGFFETLKEATEEAVPFVPLLAGYDPALSGSYLVIE